MSALYIFITYNICIYLSDKRCFHLNILLSCSVKITNICSVSSPSTYRMYESLISIQTMLPKYYVKLLCVFGNKHFSFSVMVLNWCVYLVLLVGSTMGGPVVPMGPDDLPLGGKDSQATEPSLAPCCEHRITGKKQYKPGLIFFCLTGDKV